MDDTGLTFPMPLAFGEDVDGELYIIASGRISRISSPTEPVECADTAESLCLGGRFAVTASWRVADGSSGAARAVRLTEDSGYFWFFDEDNVELVVKVLDACVPFERFWTFAAGLTDVEVELRVFDTRARQLRRYSSALGGAFRPLQDPDAFATCP